MNKGIKRASREYVYFLDADDCLIDTEIIAHVANYMKGGIDILYGKVYMIKKKKYYIQMQQGRILIPTDVISGYMAPHQGMFVKREIMRRNMFNTQYKIYADYDLFLKLNLGGRKILYINDIIAYFFMKGIRSVNCYRGYKKMRDISIAIQ